MPSIMDVSQDDLVKRASDELRSRISMPEWARFVKTGVSRERVPDQDGWWYTRSASILKRLYVDGNVGTQRLRSYYGGLHRRGHKPAHFGKGSGKIIRVILQDLEKAGLVKKEKRGRTITPEGIKFLNSIAKKMK